MPYAGPDQTLDDPPGIRTDVRTGILTITLDRSGGGNALDSDMVDGLACLLEKVRRDDDIRVLVLRGGGGDFCIGLDADGDSLRARFDEACVHALQQLPQPVLAMVRGRCRNEAWTLLAACDIVLAEEDAVFAVDAGEQAFAGTAAQAVASVMGRRAMRYHALSGACFDGREAERNGLATLVLPAQELERETQALADALADKDATAVRFTKETLRHAPGMGWDAVLSFTAAKFAELKMLQAGRPSVRAGAVDSFLAGRSKPGLGG